MGYQTRAEQRLAELERKGTLTEEESADLQRAMHAVYVRERRRATQPCSGCGKALSRRTLERGSATGLCASCHQAKRRKARVCLECGCAIRAYGAKRCQPCNNRMLASDTAREKRRMERAMEARFSPEALARHRQAVERNRERVMGWCPVEYRAEYQTLRKRVGAAAAKAQILAKLSPFERQLALVRSGKARIVEVSRIPARSVEQSLIGNASALMVAA